MTSGTTPPDTGRLPQWQGRSLAHQFALAGGVVMLLAMLIVGNWVAGRIEEAVVRNTANATAQYMESFISPLSQDLADSDARSPGARQALEEIFRDTALGERVVSFKLWKPDGTVVESSDPDIVGQAFEVTDSLRRALGGAVSAEFQNLGDAEDQGEHALGIPLLEIYSPIHEAWSGRIIGVAEFYEVASGLERDLAQARRRSWMAVGLVMLAIGASLFAIVLRGSRTIDRQGAALGRQLQEMSVLSQRNTDLRQRVQKAAARASAMNDQALRRIGADLHDGPAQLLGYAALRLDNLRARVRGKAALVEVEALDRAVKDAMREIRTISRGLSLPDIQNRDIADLVASVVDAHRARTGTEVAFHKDLPDRPPAVSPAIKLCLYRFVQEGLNNAWRYAGGAGQEVALTLSGGTLRLAVRDRGPGFAAAGEDADVAGDDRDTDFHGLGLAGLRDRVESLGGTFEAVDRPGGGVEIWMELELREA